MENNKECYELTLTPNYVSDWGFQDAIRELIQNGTDQEILDKDNKFTMEYDKQECILRLINTKSKLSVNTLLLGRSSKSNNDDTVGKFGEGYKIASLVLNRLDKTFTIRNNGKNEIWTSKFKNSAKWKEKILTFYVEKVETEDDGLVIEIGNVTRDEYKSLEETWLNFEGYYNDEDEEIIHTLRGDILTNEYFKGKIFVNGLSISSGADLDYGYNFKPKYIKVERDRKTCDSWNIKETTCLMISEAMVNGDLDFDRVSYMMEKGSDDTYNIQHNVYETEVKIVKERLIESFDEKNKPKFEGEIVVPVNNQEQMDKVELYGGRPILVNYSIGNVLAGETNARIQKLVESPINKELSLKEKFQRWYDMYSKELSDGSKSEIQSLIKSVYQ